MATSNSEENTPFSLSQEEWNTDFLNSEENNKHIIVFNHLGIVNSISTSAQKVIKENLEKVLIEGGSIIEIIPQARISEFLKAVKSAFKLSKHNGFELNVKNNQFLYFSFLPQFDTQGKLLEMAVLLTLEENSKFPGFSKEGDVTEKGMRDEHAMLRTIIDNIPDYIFALDTNNKTLLSNKKFYKYLGKKSEKEVLGLKPTDYFPIEEGREITEDNKRVMESGIPVINREDLVIDYKNEKEIILLTKTPFKNESGKIMGLVGIGRNITPFYFLQKEQQLISDVIKALNKSTSLQSGLRRMVKLVAQFFNFDAAEAWAVGYNNASIKKIADYNLEKIPVLTLKNVYLDPGQGLAGTIWKNRKIESWKNPKNERLIKGSEGYSDEKISWAIGIPVIHQGNILAVLTFFDKDPKKRKIDVKEVLTRVSLQISSDINRKVSETQLNKIYEFSPNLMGVIGLDGYLKRINPAFTNIFGYSEEKLLKTAFKEFLHPDDKELTMKLLTEVAQGRSPRSLQNRCKTKEGEWKWISWQPYKLMEEQGIVQIYGKDITAEKEIIQEIQLAKERYELVSRAIQEAIYDWDVENDILAWNDSYYEIFGYDKAKNEQPVETWTNSILESERNRVLEDLNNVINDPRETKWDCEYHLVTGNGETILVIDRGFIIRNEIGEATRMIGSLQNISVIRENEKMLQELNSNLKNKAQELEASNAELEQFAYIASHDLQEPLRMVTSFLSQLQKKYDDKLDDRARKYIHFANDGAVRMRQIILDLLEYSRVGKLDYNLEKIDINLLLKEIERLYEKLFEETGAQLTYGDLPVIKAAKTPLLRVLSNLISNGIKYSKEGVSPEISIAVIEREQEWEFEVSDNGLGINEKFYDKIFVIFQRLHSKDHYSGTGIGLAICKKIVENHGGEIWVNSEEKKGSKFHFTIKKQF